MYSITTVKREVSYRLRVVRSVNSYYEVIIIVQAIYNICCRDIVTVVLLSAAATMEF